MSTLLDQLRTEFENLKARAANAEARATAAEEELKRYQRADVGERVREYAHDHEQDTRDIPRLGIGATAERMHRQRGELLDIARQQQAEIERLKERLRAYDEADTIPVLRSSDCLHCYREHETCPYHSKYADRITPRTDTKPQPKVEPELLGASESLPEAPTEEAYRPGLPPEALRKAWPEWEDSQGDRLRFTEDGERFGFLTLSGAAIESESTYIAEDSNGGQFAVCKHRPHGATWFEVEQRAARLLGEQDAKAGRDRIPLHELQAAVFGDCDGRTRPTLGVSAAYHAGYDGAIEYRDYKAIERAKVPPGLRTFIWEGAPDNQPLWRPSVDDCPIPWSRVGG